MPWHAPAHVGKGVWCAGVQGGRQVCVVVCVGQKVKEKKEEEGGHSVCEKWQVWCVVCTHVKRQCRQRCVCVQARGVWGSEAKEAMNRWQEGKRAGNV